MMVRLVKIGDPWKKHMWPQQAKPVYQWDYDFFNHMDTREGGSRLHDLLVIIGALTPSSHAVGYIPVLDGLQHGDASLCFQRMPVCCPIAFSIITM